MSSASHGSADRMPGPRDWSAVLVPELWASLAIFAMWAAVSISAVWGPDFVSTSGSGASTTTIPSGIVVAVFASIGTWAVAKYALGPRRRPED